MNVGKIRLSALLTQSSLSTWVNQPDQLSLWSLLLRRGNQSNQDTSKIYFIIYNSMQTTLMFEDVYLKVLKETVPVKNNNKDKEII